MTTTTTSLGTVVGAFESASQAQKAVSALRAAGIAADDIGIVSPESEAAWQGDASGSKMEEGAMAGLVTGAGMGALWGLGILSGVIPGVGPAIAAGTLGALLSSAGAGAAAAGIGGALIGLGIPEKDAAHYGTEYEKGRTIVTVRGARTVDAQSILNQFGASRDS